MCQAYIDQLRAYPLRTKMLTAGSLSALQELIASWIAHDRSRHGHYFTARVPKMALYGAFVSVPMGQLWIKLMHFLFARRTSLRAKVMQIIISNLLVRDCSLFYTANIHTITITPYHHNTITP